MTPLFKKGNLLFCLCCGTPVNNTPWNEGREKIRKDMRNDEFRKKLLWMASLSWVSQKIKVLTVQTCLANSIRSKFMLFAFINMNRAATATFKSFQKLWLQIVACIWKAISILSRSCEVTLTMPKSDLWKTLLLRCPCAVIFIQPCFQLQMV